MSATAWAAIHHATRDPGSQHALTVVGRGSATAAEIISDVDFFAARKITCSLIGMSGCWLTRRNVVGLRSGGVALGCQWTGPTLERLNRIAIWTLAVAVAVAFVAPAVGVVPAHDDDQREPSPPLSAVHVR